MSAAQDPRRYYRVEARELLDGLSSELLALSRGEVRPEASARLFRYAHTLKGAAIVVGDDEVAETARLLEDVLGAHRDEQTTLSPQEVTEFLRMLVALEAAIGRDGGAASPVEPGAAEAAVPAPGDSLAMVRVELEELDGVTESLNGAELQAAALRQALSEIDAATHSLGLLFDDLTSAKGGDARRPRGVQDPRLRDGARDLIDRLQRARRTALARSDSITHELEQARERVERLELVPAASVFPALERAARLAAAELDKQVDLEVLGGDVRLDRRVLPPVGDVLLHLIRNAVDHGIEAPSEREARGKPAAGRLVLRVERRGSRVAFVCEDDGAGIDAGAVRRLAIERGLASASEADALDDAAALHLLFRAGVSTRSAVTDLSGRGVGLDVAEATARALHGEATMSSQLGVGTRVELVVPVSLSTASVVVLWVADTSVLLPLDAVRSVARVPANSLCTSPRGETLLHGDELLPVLRLATALGLGPRGETEGAVAVLVISVGEQRCALVADKAFGIIEVVVRPLPWAAGTPLGVAGAALDVDGASRLVLDPRGLLTILQHHAGIAPEPAPAAAARRPLPILVIDDSLTTRMLEQSILETAGFEVDVATSAEEGLGMARARDYGLFVVDVEMPGMNGFDFTTLTRGDARLQEIPVVLVTSLAAEADQRRGREAGAAAYVVKGRFDQDDFLRRVRTLTRVET